MSKSTAPTLLGLCLGVTLTACNGPSPPAPSANLSPPPPIDGTYSGLAQLDRGEAVNCGNENPITLQVANHAFTYRLQQPQAEWQPVIVFNAMIAPDGTFDARTGPDAMSGTLNGGLMQGVIIGDICSFSFNASRGGPW